MSEIFSLVLTTSLYAGVVGLVTLLLKAVLRNRINALWHYLLWVVLILKLLVPFGPESAVSLFNKVPVQVAQTRVADMASPVEREQAKAGGAPGVETPNTSPATAVQTEGAAASPQSPLPGIWAAGAGAMLLGLLWTNYSFHRRLRGNTLKTDERTEGIFRLCQQKMGVKANIALITQDIVGAPALFGIIRPRILLTPALCALGNRELQYVLLHELAHYKRKDVLVNYLLLFLQAVHWFNPVLWYCFKRLRQDMEAATDERVLGVLASSEYKEYGRALLAVLEGLNAPPPAPRLLGMVDEGKHIEKRIRMIKMAGVFQSRKRVVMATGILCVAILGGVLLTNGRDGGTGTKGGDAGSAMLAGLDAGTLLRYKSPYIGDASNVSNLLNALPLGEYRQGIALDTEKEPYGLTARYDLTGPAWPDGEPANKLLLSNAAVLFSLIDNLDILQFDIQEGSGLNRHTYTRDALQIYFDRTLTDYARDKKAFDQLLSRLKAADWTYAAAARYFESMGVKLDDLKEVRIEFFENDIRKVITVLNDNGDTNFRLIDQLNQLELIPLARPGAIRNMSKGVYLVLDTGESEHSFYIDYITGGIARHMPAMSSLPMCVHGFANPEALKAVMDSVVSRFNRAEAATTVDQAVAGAILSQNSAYADWEAATEGHVILDTEEKDGLVTVYTISSFGAFGFENGIFTKISGSGAIPTVITLTKDEQGRYFPQEYKEPMDGAYYADSLKDMFPSELLDKALSAHTQYLDLVKQQEEQAKAYLQSIGRNARVSAGYVEKKPIIINVEASNKLFAKTPGFAEYPYWQGSRERVENGVRYIYETAQGKTDDGHDLVLFKKTKEDGAVVEEYRYQIIGSEPQLMALTSYPTRVPETKGAPNPGDPV